MKGDDLKVLLLQAFSEEAPELLERCEQSLILLERQDKDAVAHTAALKRHLHSFKGSVSAIGRSDLRDVCHAMEDRLLLSGDVTINDLDLLHEGLRYLRSGVVQPDVLCLPEDLLRRLTADVLPVEHHAEPLPSSLAAASQIPVGSQPVERERPVVLTESIRVAIPKIENLQSCIGELVAVRLQQEDSLHRLAEAREQILVLNQQWRLIAQDLREVRGLLPRGIALRLDARAAAYSGSLKSIQRSLSTLSSQMTSQTGQISLLSEAMDSGIRAIRMMPLGPFLESFRTVARDAARTVGKQVILECDDRGIEVDRLVLEQIRDPLMHLIRNAVGHGIESPTARLAAGKPEVGLITLRAELQGDHVSLTVVDDGAGFNQERIYHKAVSMGLLRQMEELTEEKMLEVVTRPGFSTAHTADTVSGRGIGMDIVATLVYELGGSLSLQTMEDVGTNMTLRVPMSLATTQGLVAQVGTQRYGITLETVERIVRAPLDSLGSVEGRPVLFLDEQPLAITSLAAVLGLSLFEPEQSQRAYPILVLRMGSQRLAVIVDDIPGEIPMIVKPLGDSFDGVALYAGGALMADGSVLPIVETRYVIQQVSGDACLRMASVPASVPEGMNWEQENVQQLLQRSILVVDDSITTRTLERNILEAAGYRVFVATDGVEALDLLRTEDTISLLVTDLEMPRMNGLELCRAVRQGRHARLPIIMVTSIGSEDEKARGMNAGADAYIVKGNFQQDHFLSTVQRFVHA